MLFFLIIIAFSALFIWINQLLLLGGLFASLCVWFVSRLFWLRKIMGTNELPICLLSKRGTIVESNQIFKTYITSFENIVLSNVIEILETEPYVIASDQTGRHWKLVYIYFGKQTVIYFIAISEDPHSWVYELPMPSCFIDLKGKLLAVNRYFLPFLDNNWQNAYMSQYIAKNRLRDWNILLEKLLSMDNNPDQQQGEIELLWQGKKGLYVKLFIRRHQEGFIVFLYDLSEFEFIKQQAQRSQNLQLLGQLSAGVVHDFNNLLTAISGFCYLLQEQLPAEHKANRDIREIQHSTARAQELIKQLLFLTDKNTNDDLKKQIVDIRTFIQECNQTFLMLLGPKIQLDIVFGKNLLDKYGSKDNAKESILVNLSYSQLFQILMNLIINAKDANATNIVISLDIKNINSDMNIKTGILSADNYVVLSVKDNGDGIKSELQEKILKEFFTTKEEGSGIGLATICRILSISGGGLDFDSDYQETIFKIYIPEHNSVVKANIVDRKVENLNNKILLVEDDILVKDLTIRALQYNGFDVYGCEDGIEALEMLAKPEHKARPFDLMITDAIMPKMNGVELVYQVRKNNEDLKIVFMSGLSSKELQEKLPNDVIILQKPIKIKELIQIIKEI